MVVVRGLKEDGAGDALSCASDVGEGLENGSDKDRTVLEEGGGILFCSF